MRFHPGLVAGMIFILLILPACGGDGSDNGTPGLQLDPAGITITDAWMRPAILPEGHPTAAPGHQDHGSGVISALYLSIENSRSQPVQLVAVETDVAAIVEMHRTENQNGLMRMQRVDAVDIPAGDTIEFAPGGLHIMLIDITEQLEPGDTVEVTFIFNTGDRVTVPDVAVIDQ